MKAFIRVECDAEDSYYIGPEGRICLDSEPFTHDLPEPKGNLSEAVSAFIGKFSSHYRTSPTAFSVVPVEG